MPLPALRSENCFSSVHVIAGLDAASGGPTYSVVSVCKALASCGVDVELATLDADEAHPDVRVRSFAASGPLARLGGAPAMQKWLAAKTRDTSALVVHSHGLWRMPNIYCDRATANVRGAVHVVSTRGMVSASALQRSKLRKSVFWHLAQKRALKRADAFHATSQAELEDIRRLGLKQPVILLPNGIDIPDVPRASHAPAKPPLRTVLFLGRIHPIKGLSALIEAWANLSARFPNWRLQMVGPEEGGHRHELEALAATVNATGYEFLPSVYGAEKFRLLREADLFVLPSQSENFGVSVAEALACAVPAVVSTGAPWAGLVENKCGWWVEPSPAQLEDALSSAMAQSPETLQEMGRRGQAWMQKEFRWPSIAEQLSDAYRWLIAGGDKPECVVT